MANIYVFSIFLLISLFIDNSQAVYYCEFEESYWSTDYEVPHTFDCPDPQQGMTFFESCHDNGYEDRVWNYRETFTYDIHTEGWRRGVAQKQTQ